MIEADWLIAPLLAALAMLLLDELRGWLRHRAGPTAVDGADDRPAGR